MSATSFIDAVGADVPKHVRENEFLALAREGKVTKEHLRRFALAEFQSQEAEFAAYGLLLSRYHHEVPGGFFSFVAYELMQARHRMVGGAAGSVGMTPDEMRHAPIEPAVKRFTEFISWVALHAGPAEAALLARTDFTLWCTTCAELADAVRELDEVPQEIVSYIDAYRENPPEVADGVLEVIEYGLAQGEPEEWITRSAVRMDPALRAWWHNVVTGEDLDDKGA
ncbi:hypothetical protein RND61_13695 [Streptomyces sp. TRM76323]|uniref:Thiaminase-2/PQQC domain-containing protein n=1 Tax=Streptomyces tamarix TaxID=3078565 RepID=A0ABU3QK58_9ACTN|nr:hypothetical protein [Streptomyces tamarix]MDT9683117.1 hypothetical protein [Streptomyces tamarix]